MAHKRVAQSPFAQLQEPGSDMLTPPKGESPFKQVFKAQAKPLVPSAQEETSIPQPQAQPPGEAPKAKAAPPPMQASYTPPPAPPAWQGPLPTTSFQDRMGDVTQAIAQGTFDPSGQNFTTYGPDMHGQGHTPGLRFVDAAARSAGVQMTMDKSGESFVKSLTGMPINQDNFQEMLANTAPSVNIEDRRGERTWMNKPLQQWNATDKADYAAASEADKNAYMTTMINGSMGNRENYASEYQADPNRTNQEAQQ